MKRIVVHIPRGAGVDPFKSLPEHNGREPFIVLRDRLLHCGYEIAVTQQAPVQGSDWVFFFDVDTRDFPARLVSLDERAPRLVSNAREPRFFEQCVSAGLEDRLILFLWEPPAVIPENYDVRFHHPFRKVLTWHDGLVDGTRYLKYRWPQPGIVPRVPPVPYGARKLLVNFSGNKISRSAGELYSARKRTIRYFEEHYAGGFELYGPGWGDDGSYRHSAWKGVAPNKCEIYPRFRFGLTYENMEGIPGWVSEKLFDCMRAACVPVYLGAPNISDYVDADAFVDRRLFPSDEDLARYLSNMPEKEWQQYRKAAEAYLASARFTRFLPDAFAETVLSALAG